MSQRTIVAVDGIDGSGKSSFAAALARATERVGAPAVVVSIDDFRRPVDFDRLDPGEETAAYYDRYYDFDALDDALLAFLNGAPSVSIPLLDLERRAQSERAPVAEKTLSFSGRDLAIVEGVFAGRSRCIGGGLLIRLEVELEEARTRILGRDAARGRPRSEIERRIDRRYFPGQRRYLATFDAPGRADLLIDNRDPARPRVVRWDKGRFPPALAAALASCLGAAI